MNYRRVSTIHGGQGIYRTTLFIVIRLEYSAIMVAQLSESTTENSGAILHSLGEFIFGQVTWDDLTAGAEAVRQFYASAGG